MKTMKKLCQATIRFVLAISMVFGTGITSVFANEPGTADPDKVAVVNALLDELKTLDPELKNVEFQNMISGIEERVANATSNDNEYLDNVANVIEGVKDFNTDLYSNKTLYEQAIAGLDAQELYYNEHLIEYIQSVIDNNVTPELNESFNALIQLIQKSDSLATTYNSISGNEEIAGIYDTVFEQYTIVNYETATSNDFIAVIGPVLNSETRLNEIVANVNTIASDNTLTELVVNGLELDVNELTGTIYVGYQVEVLDVIATTTNGNASVQIIKPEVLVVGNNEVRIIVTSLDGQVREYILNVIRQGEFADQGDAEDETTNTQVEATPLEVAPNESEEVAVTTLANTNDSANTSTVEDEETTTDEEKDEKEAKKYDEEIAEDEEGLNGFTVLLIVGGIALIGFGIYMLFGDKDDEIPKVKGIKNSKNNSKSKNRK